jgi:hypothetical protein
MNNTDSECNISLKYREFPDYCISIPNDWSLDPYLNNNWCHNFYSLRWIQKYVKQWIENARKGMNPLLCIQDFLEYHKEEKNKKNNFYISKLADHTMAERLKVFSDIWIKLTSGDIDYLVIDKLLLKNEIKKLVEELLGESINRVNSNSYPFLIQCK